MSPALLAGLLLVGAVAAGGAQGAADSPAVSAAEPTPGTATQRPGNSRPEVGTRHLEPGSPVEERIAGGESRFFEVAASAGQYLVFVAEGEGLDLLLTLFTPDGTRVVFEDRSDTGQRETLVAIAEIAGKWRLEVRAFGDDPAERPFRVTATTQEATSADRLHVAAQTALSEGFALQNEGSQESFEKAATRYREAVALFEKAGETSDLITTLSNLGMVLDRIGKPLEAVPHYEKAITLAQKIGNRNLESLAIHNLAASHERVGRLREALALYERALAIERTSDDRRLVAGTVDSMGRLFMFLGEWQRSLDHLNEGLDLRRQLGDRGGEARSLANIGATYWYLGDQERALVQFRETLGVFRAVGDRLSEATILNNIGKAHLGMGDLEKAQEHFDAALELARTTAGNQLEARILFHLGLVRAAAGEDDRAIALYGQSLAIWKTVGSAFAEAEVLEALGRSQAALGQWDEAQRSFETALRSDRALSPSQQARTLHSFARLERARGHVAASQERIEKALSLIESLRGKVGSQELRKAYFGSKRDYYEFYIDLLMQRHASDTAGGYLAKAFEASERARARSFLEMLQTTEGDIRQGVDPDLLAREQTATLELNEKAYRLQLIQSRAHSEAEATKAGAELRTASDAHERTLGSILQSHPTYGSLLQPHAMTLLEVQSQILDPDTALLEFSLGEERSYLWVVTEGTAQGFALPPGKIIDAAARRLFQFTSSPPGRVRKPPVENAASELGRMLLGPATAALEGKRLAIVADGALEYVPFGLLSLRSAAGYRPLVLDHEIVSLPSASILATLRRRSPSPAPTTTVAVLADPVFSVDDPRVRRAAAAGAGGRHDAPTESTTMLLRSAGQVGLHDLQRLAYTRREAMEIEMLAKGGDVFTALGFSATRNAVQSPEVGSSRIVHFATHGLLNSQHPELSGLVLSLVSPDGEPQDGFLRLHDVYNLKLRSDLVVLSACQTALGKQIRGEGLTSLTRGFMHAGADRVVATLWDVRDDAAAEMMRRFYRNLLKDRMSPPAALRKAQISMHKDARWAAPFNWGAYVLQGDWR